MRISVLVNDDVVQLYGPIENQGTLKERSPGPLFVFARQDGFEIVIYRKTKGLMPVAFVPYTEREES